MITADTPNLWEIRRMTDHATAVGIIVLALLHTARLVNIDKNIENPQIGEIANDILSDMGYLKVEEVKYVLKRAMRREKIYARLDYNIIMGWFDAYIAERDEIAIDISNQKEAEALTDVKFDQSEITFNEYLEHLKSRASQGDAGAKELLDTAIFATRMETSRLSNVQRHQKEIEYKQWLYGTYLKKNGKKKKA